jgi:hypothetical protein
MKIYEVLTEFDNISETDSNAAIVKSLVDPAARQRFAKMRSDTTAKLTDPNYDHNPDALKQHNAAPKQQQAEWIENVKNVAEFDNPYQIIRIALNKAGLTPQEVLQNLPKGYKLPTTEPRGTDVPTAPPQQKSGVLDKVSNAIGKGADAVFNWADNSATGKARRDLQQSRKDQGLQDALVAPGAGAEINNKAGMPAPTAQLFKGVHIEVRPNKVGGFDIISDNSPAAATVVQSFDNVEDANKYAKMLDDDDVKALSSMSPSIKVSDDADLNSLRRNAGL